MTNKTKKVLAEAILSSAVSGIDDFGDAMVMMYGFEDSSVMCEDNKENVDGNSVVVSANIGGDEIRYKLQIKQVKE